MCSSSELTMCVSVRSQVKKIRDDVEYYTESNQDPTFVENDFLYDDINMDSLEEMWSDVVSDVSQTWCSAFSGTVACVVLCPVRERDTVVTRSGRPARFGAGPAVRVQRGTAGRRVPVG